jgi:hypothetical protein
MKKLKSTCDASYETNTQKSMKPLICIYKGCTTYANFGNNSKKRQYCKAHAPEGFTNVAKKKCKHEGCTVTATFGMIGSKIVDFCTSHKPSSDYVNLKNKTCLFEDCMKQPCYGVPGSKKAEFCVQHAPLNYRDIKSKKCLSQGCEKHATFGNPDCKKREYCSLHAPLHYKDLSSNRCQFDKRICFTTATFGEKNTKHARFCKLHALPGYVDVKNVKCTDESCDKVAVFGDPIRKKREYCKTHAPSTYTNVVDKRCKHVDCQKIPTFGKSGSKIKEYCKDHAPSDYVSLIKSGRCINANCNKFASFAAPNSKCIEYCSEHAPSNYIDLKSKKCLFQSCTIKSSYGKPGSKKSEFCAQHKPPNYIHLHCKRCTEENCVQVATYQDLNNKFKYFCKNHLTNHANIKFLGKRCVINNCLFSARYNYPGYSQEYCGKHKTDRMVRNPKKRKREEDQLCTYCAKVIHYNEEYCSGCKTYIKLGNKTQKTHDKELRIKTLLEENCISFTHDQVVVEGCSKKRPDFQIQTDWGTLIVEIDEFQHKRKNYSCECELTRMKQIYYDVGSPCLLFVRYNPDAYKPLEERKQVSSAFREETLLKVIHHFSKFENKPEFSLSVLYLFYDGFLEDCSNLEEIQVL